MVKILSLVLFVAAFIWTWCMFNSPAKMGIDTHAGIQSKLTLLIEDTVKAKKPNMTNFKLLKMYTEQVDDNKVMAHFAYQYDDSVAPDGTETHGDVATRSISGEATLIKALSEDPAVQKWVLQTVKTGNESLDFKEGTTITSDGKTTETETPAASPPENEQPKENK